MTDDPSRPIAVVLTEEEVEFVKDALWYASRAEQVALADDPLFRDSFLAELKSTSLKREADGKPGFQDLFLVMQGVPAEELPPAAQQRLGVIGSDYQPPAEVASLAPAVPPAEPAPQRSGVQRVLRGLRDFFLGE